MQSVPDPSWKYGPKDDGFDAFVERFREQVLDNWTVGDLLDHLPTRLNNDVWCWIEDEAEAAFKEAQDYAHQRGPED